MNNVDVTTGIAESSNKEIEYQSHTPASYFIKFVSIDPEFDLPEHDNFEFPQQNTYVGEDAAEHFLDYVQTVADQIFKKYIKKPKEMIYTEEDRKTFDMAKECHICSEEFIRENETTCDLCIDKPDVIMRDHCHILGVNIYCFMFFLLF